MNWKQKLWSRPTPGSFYHSFSAIHLRSLQLDSYTEETVSRKESNRDKDLNFSSGCYFIALTAICQDFASGWWALWFSGKCFIVSWKKVLVTSDVENSNNTKTLYQLLIKCTVALWHFRGIIVCDKSVTENMKTENRWALDLWRKGGRRVWRESWDRGTAGGDGGWVCSMFNL